MRILQLNSVCGRGGTGKISVEISNMLSDRKIDNLIVYTYGTAEYEKSKKCSNYFYIKFQALKSRIFGNYGFNSKIATGRILSTIEKFQPDIVHIHNIHGHDCHLGRLFSYLRDNKIKIVWTLHDCWAFTGYCPYFDAAECDQWQTQCALCPQWKKYSWFLDRSAFAYTQKKNAFSHQEMVIVTPSQWLAQLAQKSFLKEYPIRVINNGIDLSLFKPTQSEFRKKYHCENKHILLGVSYDWDTRKGLDVFIELSRRLDDKYQIVLVGTNKNVDKNLPSNIISIHRTQSQRELAEIYTAADVFINPTAEENFPTVNMESLACGTPVITYATGGSGEIIDDTCGAVVQKNDIDAVEKEIVAQCTYGQYKSEDCVNRARQYESKTKFNEYIDLYNHLLKEDV